MRSLFSKLLFAFALIFPIFAEPAPDTTKHKEANVKEDVLSIPKVEVKAPPEKEDAVPAPKAVAKDVPVNVGAAAGATNSEESSDKPTIFNGMEVPPMKEIDGSKFGEQIKEGYWFVKFYSPYCGHCIKIAPVWQTLYEYYFTQKPVPSSPQTPKSDSNLNSFHRYYSFNFASLDCIAFGDACSNNKVTAFPMFILFKNGEFVKKFEDNKDLAGLSHFVEETLDSIRPGSRPSGGVKLPEVGAKSVNTEAKPDVPAEKDKDIKAGKAAAEQHMEKILATKSATKTTKAITNPTKAAAPANPLGTSISLSQESFQNLVTTTQDPWFVKFYVPWCHHCQNLAPNWLQMSKELQGKLNVGEVNCEIESRLCKDVKVRAYPTIHYFRGGERVEYDGLRGLGDLVSYARKALDTGSGVQYVDAETFKEMEETEEVIFVYFYDHATTSEDFEALDRLTLSLIGHAKIVKTDSAMLADRFKISTWPRLVVSRDGRASYYTALAPRDMRDFRAVLNWMQSVWLPIVPELTASNSREIMDGKLVVLGILSRERSDEFILNKREIKNAALEWMDKRKHAFQLERQEMRDTKQLRIEEAEDRNDQRALRQAKSIQIRISEEDRKQVGFAWVDGVFWERWIRTTYGVDVRNDGERIIVNDEDNHRYWDTTATGSPILCSRSSILETLPKIVSSPPRLASKSTTGKFQQGLFALRALSRGHPWLTLGLALVALVGAGVWGRGRIRRKVGAGGGGFFMLDGEKGSGGGNGGGSGGGKVD